MKHSEIEILKGGTNDATIDEVQRTTSSQTIAKPNVSGSFSYNDMLAFAHYLRNGLTNMEYCQKEHEEHLEFWCLKKLRYCPKT